ncbi:hypothetical protein HPB52_018055 [Rhipicephalus sanguineus]|uniref:Proteasome component Ecm29 N-terminal domain-containing protein n=1 Tax=Rhipicephalus sanguineus TaxID=34632 RepID=A0A9D4T1E3_RHISA|nr:hypothetical protein HPB52_018055 [Rhipicephalus sanguineus]
MNPESATPEAEYCRGHWSLSGAMAGLNRCSVKSSEDDLVTRKSSWRSKVRRGGAHKERCEGIAKPVLGPRALAGRCRSGGFFARAEREESSEGRLTLQEALVAVAPAYAAWADDDTQQLLLALVSTHASAPSATCRHAALRYAATVYAADYAPARYLLLMAAGDR